MSPFERQQMYETGIRQTSGAAMQRLADQTTAVGLSFVRSEQRRRATETHRAQAIENVRERLDVLLAMHDVPDYPHDLTTTAANIVDAVKALWPDRS